MIRKFYRCGCGHEMPITELAQNNKEFCPKCGKKKDGRTWKTFEKEVFDFNNMGDEKIKTIVSSMKQTIKRREESRRQSEGLLL